MKKFTMYNVQFTIKLILFIFTFYILHSTFYITPAYAAVNIGQTFGFGDLTSLGQATSKLVVPVFSIATALVVIYFLLGAFDYLKSGGNKEEVQKAREKITQGIVGFIILMFAFFILQFLLFQLFGIRNFLI